MMLYGKRCTSCDRILPFGSFYRQSKGRSGYRSSCKACESEKRRARHKRNMADPEWVIDRRRRAREEWARRKKRGGPIAEASPEKRAAMSAVNNAVQYGRLARAEKCERCGHDFSMFRCEAHHHSYEPQHKLDVEWLCSKCHRDHHATERRKKHEQTDPDGESGGPVDPGGGRSLWV